MGFCKCLGTCVGGFLFGVGAAFYYTCKWLIIFTCLLIYYACYYAYIGISWPVKKIFNNCTKEDNRSIPQTSYYDYSPVNISDIACSTTARNYPASVHTRTAIERVVIRDSNHIRIITNSESICNNRDRDLDIVNSHWNRSENDTFTAKNIVRANPALTNRGVVSGHANTSNVRKVISSNSDNGQINNESDMSSEDDNKEAKVTTQNTNNSPDTGLDYGIVPVHSERLPSRAKRFLEQHFSNSDTTHHVANEVCGNNGTSRSKFSGQRRSRSHYRNRKKSKEMSGYSRSTDRSNSQDEKGKHELLIPTSIVKMPTRRTVSVSLPSGPQCRCKDISKPELIPLLPGSEMGGTEYQIIVDEMNDTTNQNNKGIFSSYEIISVHKVRHCCLWTKFRNRRTDIGKENDGTVNQRMLFHGSKAVDEIVQSGFDERHSNPNGMFGAGIYFAEHSSKSNHYVYGIRGGTGCEDHSDRKCYVCVRKMLLCRVVLGKSFDLKTASRMAHAPPGYHSVTGLPSPDGLRYSEYVIYRGEQAYPEYLIKYKIVK